LQIISFQVYKTVLLLLHALISHMFGTVTYHALPRLAAALYPYLDCCLLNSDTFLFHVYLLSKDDVAYAIDFICTCWLLL